MSKSKAKRHEEAQRQVENARKVREELEKTTTPEDRKAAKHEREVIENREAHSLSKDPKHVRRSGTQIMRHKAASDTIDENAEKNRD